MWPVQKSRIHIWCEYYSILLPKIQIWNTCKSSQCKKTMCLGFILNVGGTFTAVLHSCSQWGQDVDGFPLARNDWRTVPRRPKETLKGFFGGPGMVLSLRCDVSLQDFKISVNLLGFPTCHWHHNCRSWEITFEIYCWYLGLKWWYKSSLFIIG